MIQIARLRCLVKATTVAGAVDATHTGGYRLERFKFEKPVKNIHRPIRFAMAGRP